MSEIRFRFGRNWQAFSAGVTTEGIAAAETSLRTMLRVKTLAGKTFLDIGSGSGLFSLAALRLGASRVHSFDYDVDSVSCTAALKAKYAPQADAWTVSRGSVLDDDFLGRLGTFDVVYSWGVLHHTGDMWGAIERASRRVAPSGTFLIALYNDQGLRSRAWWQVKRMYCAHPGVRPILTGLFGVYFGSRNVVADLVHGTNPVRRYLRSDGSRGMRFWPDLIDWIGGFPFEVARPDDVLEFCQSRGLTLRKMRTAGGGLGNNEFLLTRDAPA